MQKFTNIIKAIIPNFPDSEIDLLANSSKSLIIKKNEIFISAGSIPRKFGFLVRGLIRYYYIDSNGKEYTKGFLAENSVIS